MAADKYVELGVNEINAVYSYPPPPVGDEEQEDGTWTATVSVQGNPFVGEGTTVDEAVAAAVEAYETRGQEPEPEPAPKPTAAKAEAK